MTEDDLIAAVLAAPAEDEPRLVYADFLQERGDLQGELITVQCAVKRLERENRKLTPEYRAAYRRERELLRQFEESFAKGPGRGFHVGFQRGFIDYVSCPSLDVALANVALFSRHPVRQLSCDVANVGDLRRLAATPFGSRLADLHLSRRDTITVDARFAFDALRGVDPNEPVWLAEAGMPMDALVPAVKRVSYWTPTAKKFEDLIAAAPPRLRELHCADGLRHTGDTFPRLTSTETFAALETLSLQFLTDRQTILALDGVGERVTSLTFMLGARPDTSRIARALAESRATPSLQSLSIACDEQTIDVLDLRAKKLEVLIAMDDLPSAGVDRIAKGTLPKRLAHLSINAGEGRPRCTSLLKAPFERLLYLGLGNYEIGFDLTKAAALDTLTGLRLYGCTFAEDTLPAIRARWPFVSIE